MSENSDSKSASAEGGGDHDEQECVVIDISPFVEDDCDDSTPSSRSTMNRTEHDELHRCMHAHAHAQDDVSSSSVLSERRAVVVSQLIHSFENLGFLYITGHGVDLELIAQLFARSEQFFSQSESEKRKCSYRAPVPRGFIGLDRENFACLAGETKPNDLVEKLRFGPMLSADALQDPYYNTRDAKTLCFANMWPESVPELQPLVSQYFEAMERLMRTLLRLFAVALNLPPSFFRDKTDRHTSILSLNRYPFVAHPKRNQIRIAPHTDLDLFTIVAQDAEAGGLEILSPLTQNWLSVPPLPDALVVNVGDALTFWTNGKWRSTMHRVVLPPPQLHTPALRPRHSLAFFVGANYDAPIECLPGCSEDSDGKEVRKHEDSDGQEIRKLLPLGDGVGQTDTHDAHPPQCDATTYIGWRRWRVKLAVDRMKSAK